MVNALSTSLQESQNSAGQREAIQIGEGLAAKDGRAISSYIQNYGIQDQNALIKIAKIAAAQDGCGTSELIQNYGE